MVKAYTLALICFYFPILVHTDPIFVIGGGGGFSSSIETFSPIDPSQNALLSVSLPTGRTEHATVRMPDGSVIIIGGVSANTMYAMRSVERFNPSDNSITKLPDMQEARANPGAAVLNGMLYVCGGWTGGGVVIRFSSCEVFNGNRWLSLASMHSERSRLAMAAVDGFLYAMGGDIYPHDGGGWDPTLVKYVERYDPNQDKWEDVKSMGTARKLRQAAVLNGYIYVCGSGFGQQQQRSCERYDPKSNQWSYVGWMVIPRIEPLLVAESGKLYATGGVDWIPNNININAKSVEEYDPNSGNYGTWTKLNKQTIDFRKGGTAVA